MATQRLIGIDFGTSTSVLRVKRYENGEPVADRLMTIPVTFNMGNSMVPTLVQKLESSTCYGYEAQISRRKAKLYQNFKVKLESSDETERTEARALTEEFFKYLAGEYNAQSESGFFGEGTDQEKTIVSFPVKWSDETKAFMIEAAKKAGFKNVEGMDEARAAIQAITVQNADMLKQKGYFMDGQPVNILMVDMGAGTTDMVLCRHTPGENGNTQILATWPKDGNVLFGGHEVDELLVSYMRKKLPEDEAATILKRCGVEKFKAWKENIISGALAKQESVTYFSDLDLIVNLLGIDMEPYALNRAEFEALAAEYLKGLPELLKGCLDEAKLDGAQIDLVILTGGHSQWYFVRELLTSGLSKIEADPNRLVSIVRPQETVALGMVYDPLAKQAAFVKRDDIPITTSIQQEKLAEVQTELTHGTKKERMTLELYSRNGLYGFRDENGVEMIPCEWSWATFFSEGLACVRKDGKYGFIDQTGKLVSPCQWDWTINFSEGLARVEADGKCGFIDPTGQLAIPCQWDWAGSFREGLACVRKDGKYGFVDRTGKLVSPCQWFDAKDFSDGLAAVKEEKCWGYIDRTGQLVIPCQWFNAKDFSEGLAYVEGDYWINPDMRGYIDRTGRLVIPGEKGFSKGFSEGLSCVMFTHFIDKTGQLVISVQGNGAESFSDGLAAVKESGKWRFIDKNGQPASPKDNMWRAHYQREGLVRTLQDGKWGFSDRTGRLVIPCQWDYVKDFSDGLASVQKDDEWNYIDRSGQLVSPYWWKHADEFSEGLAGVYKDYKWGFIDRTGQLVIPCVWDTAFSFRNGWAGVYKTVSVPDQSFWGRLTNKVKEEDVYHRIDRTGKVIR